MIHKRYKNRGIQLEESGHFWSYEVKKSFATISKSEKFEVPQWNISLNDSGIQVTLFWAEKCSSAMDSTQGINSNYCHRIILMTQKL